MQQTARIELRSVSRNYGEFTALKPTSLTFDHAQTTVLIGPSGCGKSTILRLIVGLIEPSAGTVLLDGASIADAADMQKIRHRIGYVIQEGGLFPHLTSGQNVSLMARHIGWDVDRISSRMAYLCELTHLDSAMLDRYPVQLSGGQRQRVSLMRSLMLDPDVLLLDEPLGALDPLVRLSLQKELKSIFENLQKTVVVVTHDMSEAAYLADRIVVMKEGDIQAEGRLEEIAGVDNPFVRAIFNSGKSAP